MAGVIASSMRKLVAGSGNVLPSHSGKPWRFTFTQNQQFYRGETLAVAGFYDVPDQSSAVYGVFTIAHGSGVNWIGHQISRYANYGWSPGSPTFKRTDPSPTARARGGATGDIHRLVPGALHFLYVSPLDASGNPDWYTYIDTILPINGRHPYTRDRWTGQSWLADDVAPYFDGLPVPDAATRIADLDDLPPVLSN